MSKSVLNSCSKALIFGFCFSANAAYASCPEIEVGLAMDARDLASTQALFESVQFNASCSDDLRQEMRQKLAEFHSEAADGQPVNIRIGHLKDALSLQRIWTYELALGEAFMEAKDYDQAAIHLQSAINQINAVPSVGTVTEKEANRIVRLASTAVGLASSDVEIPNTRNGTVGGILSSTVRGFKIKEIPIHVTYVFGTADFTDDGLKRAGDLARALAETGRNAIVLEGHTDPVGTEEFNMDLSVRRAEALRTFLIENGYSGDIQVVGKGETEPPIIETTEPLNQEEEYQLARRVELIW